MARSSFLLFDATLPNMKEVEWEEVCSTFYLSAVADAEPMKFSVLSEGSFLDGKSGRETAAGRKPIRSTHQIFALWHKTHLCSHQSAFPRMASQ